MGQRRTCARLRAGRGGQFDPAAVLASSWDDSIDPDDDDPEQLEQLAPFSMRFPGLAPAQDAQDRVTGA